MKRVLCLYLPYLPTERLPAAGNGQPSSTVPNVLAAPGGGTDKPRSLPPWSRSVSVLDSRAPTNEFVGATQQCRNPDNFCGNGTRSAAAVVVAVSRGTARVVQVNPSAAQSGVRPGQTLAEACALRRDIQVHHQDLADDGRDLEKLACWADCLSPVVQIEGADSLLLDVTGCERLFGGEDNLVLRAVSGLNRLGFTTTAAVADTPGAAWGLAHADDRQTIVSPPGQVAASIAHLPVWSLRLEPEEVDMLRVVGVANIEALLHLPRASLASRFSEHLLQRLDQVLGNVAEILTPFRPPPTVRAQARFAGPTDRLETLRQGVDRALVAFCDQLASKVAGTRQVYVTFYFQEARQRTIELRVSRATRDRVRLRSLLFVKLEGLTLSHRVEALVVWTRQIENLDGRQEQWFETGGQDEAELAELIDRLAARLGAEAVRRARLDNEHQPELAYRYQSLTECGLKQPAGGDRMKLNDKARAEVGSVAPARPVRLLPRPVPIPVMSVVPDGPPVRFRFNGVDFRITGRIGPERIETGWWRGRPVRRDYYHTECANGCRFWMFREQESGQWFLHGFFD